MNQYEIKSAGSGNVMKIKRVGKDMLNVEIDGKGCKVFTEDLAALVREELPKDRAMEMFSEVQEREMQSGQARVAVEAKKDIKKGEKVMFKININKYLGGGVRTTPSGIIY